MKEFFLDEIEEDFYNIKKLVICIDGNYGLMCVDIEKMLMMKK